MGIGSRGGSNHKFPFIAYLSFYDQHEDYFIFQCTVVIIGKREAVTTAHCFKEQSNASDYRVFMGTSYFYGFDHEGLKNITIERIEMHPKYATSGGILHDLAILHLGEDLVESPSVRFVKISHEALRPGQTVVVVGAGRTTNHPKDPGGRMTYAPQDIIDGKTCHTMVENETTDEFPEGKIPSTIVCAHSKTAETCKGDSGAAMLTKSGRDWQLRGINHGRPNADQCGIFKHPSYFNAMSDPSNYDFLTKRPNPPSSTKPAAAWIGIGIAVSFVVLLLASSSVYAIIKCRCKNRGTSISSDLEQNQSGPNETLQSELSNFSPRNHLETSQLLPNGPENEKYTQPTEAVHPPNEESMEMAVEHIAANVTYNGEQNLNEVMATSDCFGSPLIKDLPKPRQEPEHIEDSPTRKQAHEIEDQEPYKEPNVPEHKPQPDDIMMPSNDHDIDLVEEALEAIDFDF